MFLRIFLPCGHIGEYDTHNLTFSFIDGVLNLFCQECDFWKKVKLPNDILKLIQRLNEEENHSEQIKDSIGSLLTEFENCTIRKTNLTNVLSKTIIGEAHDLGS